MPFDAVIAPPLSILHLTSAFPVLSETFVANEVRALRAAGHQVVPLALAPHDGPCQPDDEDFRDETLALALQPALPALAQLVTSPAGLRRAWAFIREQRSLRPRSLLLAGARVALAARRQRCGHIHAHFAHGAAATAIVAARLAGITVSFTGHGYDIYLQPSDLPAKLRAADVAIAVCDDMVTHFQALAPGARVAMVPCGVDPLRFHRPLEVRPHGRLLAVGRLAPQKGYPVLLDALARIPAWRRPELDIVGDGPERAELAAQAEALGIADEVNFLGARPAGWIATHGPAYAGFVAPYVVTPQGDRDTGPLVVKEAMAMELPVVASALMGLKETVTPDCGRLLPPGDVGALAEGLTWLTELGLGTRQALGIAGRQRVERHFTITGQAAGLVAAIRALPRR